MTGSFIYDAYSGALGRQPGFAEYSSDRQQVVGGTNSMPRKPCLPRTSCSEVNSTTRYQANTTAASFVDALIQTVQLSGLDLTSERTNLIGTYNSASNTVNSRAAVVRAIADNTAFKQTEYNAAFVLTEYFSFLRRDPKPPGTISG